MANNRIAYGLCEEYGIQLPKGAKPHDAWEALKKHGIEYRENIKYKIIDPAIVLDRMKRDRMELDIEIDDLVPCLKNDSTGELVDTEVAVIEKNELSKYNEDSGWYFDWSTFPDNVKVFGVYTKRSRDPEGLVAIEHKEGFVYINFACAAPRNNRLLLNGNSPKYTGIGGHLFAIAAEESFKSGAEGYVSGYAKNEKLLDHYVDKLGATHTPSLEHPYYFVVYPRASKKLIDEYNYTRR